MSDGEQRPLRPLALPPQGNAARARRLVAAIVDRVTFNAHILETGTDSYRLRTTKARARARTKGSPTP